MFKKILLILLFSTNSFALRAGDCHCDLKSNAKTLPSPRMQGAFVVIATIPALPILITTSAGIAICNGIGYVVSWLIPTTTVETVGATLTVIKYTRPYILQTIEEKRDQLLKEKAQKQSMAKGNFVWCLMQNKFGSERNAAGRPSACEDLALAYAFVAGNAELNRRTKAFEDGKCFCS